MYTLQYNGQTRGPCPLDQIKNDLAQGIIPADALYLDETDNGWKPVSGLVTGAQPPARAAARPLPIVGIVVMLLFGGFMVLASAGLMTKPDELALDPALLWVRDSPTVRMFPLMLEMASGCLLAIGALMAAARNPWGPRIVRGTSKFMLLVIVVAAIIPLIGYMGAPGSIISSVLGDTAGKCLARIIPFALGLYLFRKKVYG